MSGINKFNNYYDVLESASTKYLAEGYEKGSLSNVNYHDPETPEQEKIAKNIASRYKHQSYLIYVVTIIFIATLIFSIWKIKDMVVISSIFVFCVVFIWISIQKIKDRNQKVQVITGKAIYKNIKTSASSSTHSSIHNRRKTYYVAIIPDGGEKVIYSEILTSRDDYERITEGTPIMVVNKGPFACVLPHKI